MRIPERPLLLTDLDLMRQLRSYADGTLTWRGNGHELGAAEKAACSELHSNIAALAERAIQPILNRTNAREMSTFTMHDSAHGIKVAHLMWHLLKPDRRSTLTPPEIALLVLSALVHDAGMALTDEQRRSRLAADSPLWDAVPEDSAYFKAYRRLEEEVSAHALSDSDATEALFQLQQAQEALLCLDTRQQHATRERYTQLLADITAAHEANPERIPDVQAMLSFDGDTFGDKLIEICVSHNLPALRLLERDPSNPDQSLLTGDYPVGCAVADLRLVASALRIADILDFDRERTPSILFHYLLPRSGSPSRNTSVREWGKHLAISNWEISDDGVVTFRGRSTSAVIHHAILEFVAAIKREIEETKSLFVNNDWFMQVTGDVRTKIDASGYRYLPYRFSIDEERAFRLFMGSSLYPNKLDALRELVQNSVDACRLEDALLAKFKSRVALDANRSRISIEFREYSAKDRPSVLIVEDSGTGMESSVIENYLLRIGRSYYGSEEFLR